MKSVNYVCKSLQLFSPFFFFVSLSLNTVAAMVLTNDPEPVWDKSVDVPEKWIQFIDENVSASKYFESLMDYNVG